MVEEGKIVFREGEHFVEPLVVETGSQGRHIVLEAGARVHLTAFVLAGGGAVGGTDGTVMADRANGTYNAGGGTSAKFRLTVDLTGERAEFHLHALYITSGVGKEAGRADIDVRVNHLVPDCTSRQLIKGIAAGSATGSFTGMVHVAQDAQRTDASQRSQNLQLADTAHVFARPQLEIYADDVKCSHGATVGRLDQEAIYYMRQRGVSEAEARRMQLQGFAGEIITHCSSVGSREMLSEKITSLLDRI